MQIANSRLSLCPFNANVLQCKCASLIGQQSHQSKLVSEPQLGTSLYNTTDTRVTLTKIRQQPNNMYFKVLICSLFRWQIECKTSNIMTIQFLHSQSNLEIIVSVLFSLFFCSLMYHYSLWWTNSHFINDISAFRSKNNHRTLYLRMIRVSKYCL